LSREFLNEFKKNIKQYAGIYETAYKKSGHTKARLTDTPEGIKDDYI